MQPREIRLDELQLQFAASTLDGVELLFSVHLQHCELPQKIFSAYYQLATRRIAAVVKALVRARIRRIEHADLRATLQQVTEELQEELGRTTRALGCGNASITLPLSEVAAITQGPSARLVIAR